MKTDTKYIPVQMFIRVSRRENEMAERALLVARAENGNEYIFSYNDSYNEQAYDLTVCGFTPVQE